jgi:hypothetical protein
MKRKNGFDGHESKKMKLFHTDLESLKNDHYEKFNQRLIQIYQDYFSVSKDESIINLLFDEILSNQKRFLHIQKIHDKPPTHFHKFLVDETTVSLLGNSLFGEFPLDVMQIVESFMSFSGYAKLIMLNKRFFVYYNAVLHPIITFKKSRDDTMYRIMDINAPKEKIYNVLVRGDKKYTRKKCIAGHPKHSSTAANIYATSGTYVIDNLYYTKTNITSSLEISKICGSENYDPVIHVFHFSSGEVIDSQSRGMTFDWTIRFNDCEIIGAVQYKPRQTDEPILFSNRIHLHSLYKDNSLNIVVERQPLETSVNRTIDLTLDFAPAKLTFKTTGGDFGPQWLIRIQCLNEKPKSENCCLSGNEICRIEWL